jgi:hypothetical protein
MIPELIKLDFENIIIGVENSLLHKDYENNYINFVNAKKKLAQ